MRIIVAADHGGFTAKKEIVAWLTVAGYQVEDAGALTLDPEDDFPDFAYAAWRAWRAQPSARIIAWCRSGVGMNMALSRLPGLRAGLALASEQVAAATAHNQLNTLVLSAEYMDISVQKLCIEQFLHAETDPASRFQRRLEKIDSYANRARLTGNA